MQNHTAEHIVSGLFHKLFGLNNVGFHLGCDEVTIDLDGVLTREDLDRVELLANRAIYENIKVEAVFPTADELPSMEYRSKLELTENVRIVNIGEYDSCACCAPHVKFTGEIGAIKLLDFMKHRGGVRIRMLAGERALLDYRDKFKNIQEISAMLSVPQSNTAEGLRAYINGAMQTEYKLKGALSRIVELEAERIEPTDKNLVVFLKDLSLDEARELVNLALHKVSGILVVLAGEENSYKYVMASENLDMREAVKAANAALSGKGGGKPPMMQGSFCATLKDINEYFAK
jgi:alanyl-tRNA synthetase